MGEPKEEEELLLLLLLVLEKEEADVAQTCKGIESAVEDDNELDVDHSEDDADGEKKVVVLAEGVPQLS